MKQIDIDSLNQRNDRILLLLAELHSTLDLYYETVTEKETGSSEH